MPRLQELRRAVSQVLEDNARYASDKEPEQEESAINDLRWELLTLMDEKFPGDTLAEMENVRLRRLARDPKFKDGHRDGKTGRPQEHPFSDAYRAGYREGEKTASIGDPISWGPAFAKRRV